MARNGSSGPSQKTSKRTLSGVFPFRRRYRERWSFLCRPNTRSLSLTWLATSDRAVIPEILHLQLEKRGLLTKNSGDSAVDYRVIETRENQTLAIATILQPEFPTELTFERVSRFEPSAYTFALPQDRLVIWREQGRLTVAATRGRDAGSRAGSW